MPRRKRLDDRDFQKRLVELAGDGKPLNLGGLAAEAAEAAGVTASTLRVKCYQRRLLPDQVEALRGALARHAAELAALL